MPDEAKLYISIESRAGHLVVDGPMSLWREFVGSLASPPADRVLAEPESATGAHLPAETPR